MRNIAAWEEKDTILSLRSMSGHLPVSVPRVRSGAFFRRALLPIALMSKKNLFSRLALQQTRNKASCVRPSKRSTLLTGCARLSIAVSGCVVPGWLCFAGLLLVCSPRGELGDFLLAFRFGGRPAGSPSKNTAKRLDVHAGSWLGVLS